MEMLQGSNNYIGAMMLSCGAGAQVHLRFIDNVLLRQAESESHQSSLTQQNVT